MQLTDKIFKGLYRRGVMLEQMKEPALSPHREADGAGGAV